MERKVSKKTHKKSDDKCIQKSVISLLDEVLTGWIPVAFLKLSTYISKGLIDVWNKHIW